MTAPYPRIFSKVFTEPWEILPSHHDSIATALLDQMKSGRDLAIPEDRLGLGPERESDRFRNHVEISNDSRLAIMTIDGVLGKRLSWMETYCGGCDLAWIDQDIEELKNDDRIETVIFDIHSPGGLSRESSDSAARFVDLSKVKRTVAYTDSVMASAAYKLGAACDEIHTSSSGVTGSIGTFISVLDSSKAYEMEGYALRVFRDGKYKAMGTPGKALTEEEADYLQSQVDTLSKKFKSFCLSQRPGLKPEAMQGQGFSGDEALAAGLVDGLHRDLISLVAAELDRLS